VQAAVARHQAPLLRYATRLLHGDADRARDVVQDTFVRLMAQPPEQVDGHVAEWLFTVCRNRTHDVQRKEGRMSQFAEGQVAVQQRRDSCLFAASVNRAAYLAARTGIPCNICEGSHTLFSLNTKSRSQLQEKLVP